MRLLIAAATILLSALQPAPAAAHDEYLWRHERVRLTADQARRVAELERRASAADMRIAPALLAFAVGGLGNCSLAERLMAGPARPPRSVLNALYPAVSGPDRRCAGRAVAAIAAAARQAGPERADAFTLYQAGMLWRRLGAEAQAGAAVAEAERLFDAEEAELGEDLWSCHGGDCITARWFTRLHGLRLLHGTPQWRLELQRLAALAAPGLRPAGDEPPPVYIGQRVFEELVSAAAAHGEEAVGMALAPGTVYGEQGRAYHAARMHALLAEGRTAEAIALVPQAGRAFQSADPRLVAEHFAAFAAIDGFYDRFRFQFNESALAIVRALMERGDFEHARSAVAAARSGVAGSRVRPIGFAAMEGLAAFLEHRTEPVARLVRLARRDGPRSRDGELAELGLFLASRGDRRGFEEALAAVADRRVRARMLAELPCRASLLGEAAALRAVRRARGLRPAGRDDDSETDFGGSVYQSFLCLLRRGQGDAAAAYAAAIGPARLRLSIASGLPIWSTLSDPARIRRRLADIAFAAAEREDLWDEEGAIEAMAVDYERLGDHEKADLILARAEDPERRARLLIALIESYLPVPER